MAQISSKLMVSAMVGTLALLPMTAAHAASTNVVVKAALIKPLSLTAKQDFDFGQIILPQSGAAVTVSVSQAGVRSCPAPLSCSGTAKQAIFNLTGSNKLVIKISAPGINLTNAAGDTLAFTPNAPATLTLPNSGNVGMDFNIGGSITVSPTTPEGDYAGTMTVTADYQ